jgi:hypothetical protein
MVIEGRKGDLFIRVRFTPEKGIEAHENVVRLAELYGNRKIPLTTYPGGPTFRGNYLDSDWGTYAFMLGILDEVTKIEGLEFPQLDPGDIN